MNFQDEALICMNGHLINSSYIRHPENNTKFCEKCGQPTINKCPYCGESIRGEYHYDGVISIDEIDLPAYCCSCGKAYPWTEKKLSALDETVDLMEELNQEEKDEFKKSAVDIISENPRTNLSALKIKKYGAKVSQEIWSVAKDIIVQIATEASLKIMGLK